MGPPICECNHSTGSKGKELWLKTLKKFLLKLLHWVHCLFSSHLIWKQAIGAGNANPFCFVTVGSDYYSWMLFYLPRTLRTEPNIIFSDFVLLVVVEPFFPHSWHLSCPWISIFDYQHHQVHPGSNIIFVLTPTLSQTPIRMVIT